MSCRSLNLNLFAALLALAVAGCDGETASTPSPQESDTDLATGDSGSDADLDAVDVSADVGPATRDADPPSTDARPHDAGDLDPSDDPPLDRGGTDTIDTDTDVPAAPDALVMALAALQADRDAALLALSRSDGWPLAVDDGYLFVSADLDLCHLAGDFNAWEPVPMIVDEDFCWLAATAAPGDRYKYTDRMTWRSDPWSRSYFFDEFGEISLVDPPGRRLDRHFGVGGFGLLPRTVRVLVPAAEATRTLYAHDGQNLFDDAGPFGSWRLIESTPDDVLLVGIDNTVDRFAEYTFSRDRVGGTEHGGRADEYARLLDEVIRPLIRAHYNEIPPVGLMGSSLGGLVSLHIAAAQPDAWDFVASLSGALDWGSRVADNSTIFDVYAGIAHFDAVIYLDSGGEAERCRDDDGDGERDDDPTETDGYCGTLQMRDLLIERGWAFDVDLWHWWEPGAPHNEAAWAERMPRVWSLFATIGAP